MLIRLHKSQKKLNNLHEILEKIIVKSEKVYRFEKIFKKQQLGVTIWYSIVHKHNILHIIINHKDACACTQKNH